MNTPDRWLIHRRLAEDNDERLTLVTVIPEHITLIGADADTSHSVIPRLHLQNTIRALIFYKPRRTCVSLGFGKSLLAKM